MGLHEATLQKDMKAVRLLFSYGIDDQITNTKGSRAIDLLSKSLKREFLKAKQYKNKHREQLNKANLKRSTADITIAGMSLKTNTQRIQKYVHQQDHEVNFYKRKKKEIDEREMGLTSFGEECGCDIDEIAMTLQKVAKQPSISRQTEIYKILYGLTVLTLKKNPRSKKPPSGPIKALTTSLCKKLPKKKGKTVFTKEYFVKHCHNTLYALHDEMVKEE